MIFVGLYLRLTSEQQDEAKIVQFGVSILGVDRSAASPVYNNFCRPADLMEEGSWTPEIEEKTGIRLEELTYYPVDFLAIKHFSLTLQWLMEEFQNDQIVFVTWGELPFTVMSKYGLNFSINHIDALQMVSTLKPECLGEKFFDTLALLTNNKKEEVHPKDAAIRSMALCVMLSVLLDGVDNDSVASIVEPFVQRLTTQGNPNG